MQTKLFTLCIALVCAAPVFAYDFEVNGFYYDKYRDTRLTLTSGTIKYSGSITIPETVEYEGTTYSVTGIGYGAFLGCSTLTDVTIPKTVTYIGASVFKDCSILTSITIPEGVTFIGNYAFSGCSNLNTIIWNAKNCTGFTDRSTPFYYNSYGTSSDDFDITSQITSVTFGDSVEFIPAYLCYSMDNLTTTTIPKSVTSISYAAFESSGLNTIIWNARNCESSPFGNQRGQIISFTFGDNVEHIPSNLCYDMDNLTSITIPEGITSIGENAFFESNNLTSITWNAKKCSIGDACPFPVSQIAIMNFGNAVEHIPAYLCKGMSKLISITLPNSVQTIGNNAFDGCKGLKRLKLGNCVTSIGNYAFANCTNLPEVLLPQSLQTIGDYAFSGDIALTKTVIPDSVSAIGSYAYTGCTKIATVSIGKAVKNIHDGAFNGCTALQTIIVPDGVTSIGEKAFARCTSLQSAEIGKGVTSFGGGAFYNCSSLSTLAINATIPPVVTYYHNKKSTEYSFYGVPTTFNVLIPCSAAEDYEYSPYWQDMNVIPSITPILTVQVSDATCGEVVITKENTCEDTFAIITANAAEGYCFTAWNDGNTENPRTVEVTEDITYIASFAPNSNTAVEDISTENVSGVQKVFENGTIYILRGGEKYTIDGIRVM